jgi:hypothetical protein
MDKAGDKLNQAGAALQEDAEETAKKAVDDAND